jgi:hypothetical protein
MRYDPTAPYFDLYYGHDERVAVWGLGCGVRVLFEAVCELNRA